jgi:hypothetical protein
MISLIFLIHTDYQNLTQEPTEYTSNKIQKRHKKSFYGILMVIFAVALAIAILEYFL